MATLATVHPARDLSKEQGVTGLRAALNILDKWQASSEQACRILRISRSTYTRARQRDPAWSVGLDTDQLQRISMVLNIHAALRLLFDNPDNVYGFPAMANHNAFFNGRAPLEIMAQGDMISLYETYRRIDALRGAQW
ncbi:antitoxin Xre-like helix-turn-helix domain-containing protein [Pseudomonas sp. RL]|uniref:antitoxin Xre-like helix-turn-helix domain-containing protein n=1 Tax=Pseudomonas sp. RL TaxID=1452718 RepID=UPI00047F5FC1|nr:antitoxin Xre-like helix-turn-helix domain-containing protein [Pseudomonas sp. RL]